MNEMLLQKQQLNLTLASKLRALKIEVLARPCVVVVLKRTRSVKGLLAIYIHLEQSHGPQEARIYKREEIYG